MEDNEYLLMALVRLGHALAGEPAMRPHPAGYQPVDLGYPSTK